MFIIGVLFICDHYNMLPDKLLERFSGFSEDEVVYIFADLLVAHKDRASPKNMKDWMPEINWWMLLNGIPCVDLF